MDFKICHTPLEISPKKKLLCHLDDKVALVPKKYRLSMSMRRSTSLLKYF